MSLTQLLKDIRSCQICVEQPQGLPLPHAPRPVLRVRKSARLAVVGQAPGTKVHASGIPFTDRSGDRLRSWMGVTVEEFYDEHRIAIIPMGFCFPGLDALGSDLPPRKECAPAWRGALFQYLTNLDLVLLVGGYAQKWHLENHAKSTVTETVANWRHYLYETDAQPSYLPLPHPSWRNTHWLKSHPWFEQELVPVLQQQVRRCINQ